MCFLLCQINFNPNRRETMTSTNNSAQSTRLIPLVRWPEFHPYPSISSLRWMVFHAQSSGFEAVIKRVGRKVLIDEQAFFDWVASNPTTKPQGGRRGKKQSSN